MKSFSLIILLFFFAGLVEMRMPADCRAQGKNDDPALARDLQTLKEQIAQERRQEEKARSRHGSILLEIDDLNRWHGALQGELKALGDELLEVGSQVAVQEDAALHLEESLHDLLQKFCRRLKIRYCQPPGKWLDFLDGDADLTEKLNALNYGQRVLAADRALQNSCTKLLGEVKNRRLELDERRQFLLQLEEQQARKTAELEENIAKKNELLYKIQHQVKVHQELVAELEHVASKLQRMTFAKGLPETDFALLKGSLPMPVDGVVVSFFGLEKDSRFATVTNNKGIEIKARFGDPVKVVHDGQVVFAAAMKGYGNLLVVDHGGGYYSIYAHLEAFACSLNDYLRTSDIVGQVGRGVLSETASLYFEIRKDGIPEDPLSWVSQM
ncbi:MAG: peptidoglycan DD-metalloendopeptidase family protein [Deltaproteobacteria bacterium]|nr:peptidoglycan DD-metalloendopeptidase family protein [Deltaproteobacteria bacterium]